MNDIIPNIGGLSGLQSFWFIRVRDIDLPFPEAVNGVISDNINLVTDAVWSTGYCTRETGNSPREMKQSAQGNFLNKVFSGFVPGDNEELLKMFDQDMVDEHFILLYKDNNGNYKLVGNPEEYLSFEYKFEPGSRVSDRRGFLITFSGEGITPDYFYTGTFNSLQASFTPTCRPVELTVDGDPEATIQSGDSYNYITNKFTRTITKEADSDDIVSFESYSSGIIDEISRDANVDTVDYYNRTQGLALTPPYTVEKDDVINVTITPLDPEVEAVIVLEGRFDDVSISVRSPNLGATNAYLAAVNQPDKTLSIIEKSTDTVVATPVLNAGSTHTSAALRPTENMLYVFGFSGVNSCTIQKVNMSGFAVGTMLTKTLSNIGFTPVNADYDSRHDRFILTGGGGASTPIAFYDPVTEVLTGVSMIDTQSATYVYYMNFADHLEDCIMICGSNVPAVAYRKMPSGKFHSPFNILRVGCVSVVFNRNNRKLYTTDFNGGPRWYDTEGPPEDGFVSAPAMRRGGLAHDYVNDMIIGTDITSRAYGILDVGAGTVAQFTGLSAVGAETGYRCAHYCDSTGKFYISSNGGNIVRSVDPLTGAIINTITVGNQFSGATGSLNQLVGSRGKVF